MEISEVIAIGCIFVFTAIGLVTDLRTRKIPNWLTVPAFCLGLLYHVVHGYGVGGFSGAGSELLFALMGCAVGFGIIYILWLLGGMSGGDVKFVAALGCWIGAWMTVQVFVLSAILSTTLSAVSSTKKTFQLRRRSRPDSGTRGDRLRNEKELAKNSTTKHGWQVAFGVSVAIVTWVLLSLKMAGFELHWPEPTPKHKIQQNLGSRELPLPMAVLASC